MEVSSIFRSDVVRGSIETDVESKFVLERVFITFGGVGQCARVETRGDCHFHGEFFAFGEALSQQMKRELEGLALISDARSELNSVLLANLV